MSGNLRDLTLRMNLKNDSCMNLKNYLGGGSGGPGVGLGGPGGVFLSTGSSSGLPLLLPVLKPPPGPPKPTPGPPEPPPKYLFNSYLNVFLIRT